MENVSLIVVLVMLQCMGTYNVAYGNIVVMSEDGMKNATDIGHPSLFFSGAMKQEDGHISQCQNENENCSQLQCCARYVCIMGTCRRLCGDIGESCVIDRNCCHNFRCFGGRCSVKCSVGGERCTFDYDCCDRWRCRHGQCRPGGI